MPATLHLARFTPRHAARTVGRLRRGWDALKATPGLASARLFMLAELDTTTGGLPNPVKWGLLCGWADGGTRDAFLERGARRLTRDASEHWDVALDPVRVRQGTLHGWTPSTEGVERLAPDEPVMVMTHGRLRNEHVWDFTVDNRRIVREMTGGPGLEMMVGLLDHPNTRATFSLWRTQRDAVRFAYGPDGRHAPVQRLAQDVPWGVDWFFARFRPVVATGTWHGQRLL
jgi:hypothetical protein